MSRKIGDILSTRFDDVKMDVRYFFRNNMAESTKVKVLAHVRMMSKMLKPT